jgi:hypothetical protein
MLLKTSAVYNVEVNKLLAAITHFNKMGVPNHDDLLKGESLVV